MSFAVTADGNAVINLAPKTLVEEVTQNITMILLTPKFTVPLDRNFGLSARFVDKPTPVADAIIVAEIIDAIEAYEPRAKVMDITFQKDEMTGKILTRLEVEIIEGN
jgi:phage baseplate assembly protein W